MLKKVLILTASPGFGELIRQLLEDTGGFTPLLVTDPVQAMQMAQKEALALTILDADLGLQDFPAFISELRNHAPQTRLIVVPAEENPNNPQLAQLEANAVLPSPFYLPDLVAAIEQLFGPLVPQETANRKVYGKPTSPLRLPVTEHESIPAPEWLQDVSQAARYLTRLSLESSSQAALITRGEQVWAYAGELPKQAADELADTVAEQVASGDGTDLARFIHLSATSADYMLYATNLGGEYRLALVFDAQMPFSQMRAHVAELARALATAPEEVLTDREGMQEVRAQQTGMTRLQEGPRVGEPASEIPEREPVSAGVPEIPAGAEQAYSSPSRQAAFSATGPQLRYSFVLIPRLPRHQLAGDLASRLAEWLPELCLAFAWKLDEQSVQPEFLQWSVLVSSEATPESIARTMDRHLSTRIFEEFPRLGRENPSGQFWAPGYLVTSGSPPTPAQVADFIHQTRKSQGVAL
ncbi:MAG: transposase [Chloroflexi bacterium]|nr:transposase [Chloroflexota bacterium]